MAQFTLTASLAALAVATLSALNAQGTHTSPTAKPDRAHAYTTLALVYHERGDKNEARDALEKALRADPGNVAALKLMELYRYRGPQAK
ncbi:tetratricopeptide repeat protein [Henriciella sp. AS95]|uniref:tetratricopeptide repeat protein n=1 Tax=Henriciella sp. AS95 TaxID=3135782 RepID=UPI003174C897